MKLTPELQKLMTEGMPAMVATSSKSGRPNVSPKGSLRILDEEHLIFAESASPRTIANLRENPQVAVLCLNMSSRKGCRIWGNGEIVSSGPLFDQVAKDVMERRKQKINNVVKISIEDATSF